MKSDRNYKKRNRRWLEARKKCQRPHEDQRNRGNLYFEFYKITFSILIREKYLRNTNKFTHNHSHIFDKVRMRNILNIFLHIFFLSSSQNLHTWTATVCRQKLRETRTHQTADRMRRRKIWFLNSFQCSDENMNKMAK